MIRRKRGISDAAVREAWEYWGGTLYLPVATIDRKRMYKFAREMWREGAGANRNTPKTGVEP